MKFQTDKFSVITPADYRISVVGYLDKKMSPRLGGLTIENTATVQGSHKTMTILTGRMADQAALLGVLNTLYNMCMPLIAVECIKINAEGD